MTLPKGTTVQVPNKGKNLFYWNFHCTNTQMVTGTVMDHEVSPTNGLIYRVRVGVLAQWVPTGCIRTALDTKTPKVAAPAKPKRGTGFRKGTQNDMLLRHLLNGQSITRIKADHLYRIASLTRRILDLKEAGHKIEAAVKLDPTGRAYTEYSMRNAGRQW